MTSELFPLVVTPLTTGPDDFAATTCPDCDSDLDFHQPDPRVPHRILAVCPCGSWFVLDLINSLVAHLPRVEIWRGDA